MKHFRRFSLYLWLLLSDLPPISSGRLLMPAVFIGSWTVLNLLRVSPPVAFVLAGVLAQAAQIWGVLPVSVRRQRGTFGRASSAVRKAVLFHLCVIAFQVWWSDPRMSQHIVSLYCACYAAVMALGVSGDQAVLNTYATVSKDTDVPLEFRKHLLKLYALIAILVIVVNESLVMTDAPLYARVATLSLLPLLLHYVFDIALRLTHPPLDATED